jgi:hypothetical protein
MKRYISLMAIAAVMTLAACVTINVYFPEAAAERAADRFIQDVIGDNGRAEVPPPTSGGFQWSSLFIASAYAQSPNINIDTPQIQAIKERMAERHRSQLSAWFPPVPSVSPTTAWSRFAIARPSRWPTGATWNAWWPRKTRTATRFTARLRWPTDIPSGSPTFARPLPASGSPMRARAGTTSRPTAAGLKNKHV